MAFFVVVMLVDNQLNAFALLASFVIFSVHLARVQPRQAQEDLAPLHKILGVNSALEEDHQRQDAVVAGEAGKRAPGWGVVGHGARAFACCECNLFQLQFLWLKWLENRCSAQKSNLCSLLWDLSPKSKLPIPLHHKNGQVDPGDHLQGVRASSSIEQLHHLGFE